ncbi:cyclin-like protein [Lipomyces japonicus]|uniref:cyclin-like protein n=1 Tax=Lipomyces japonicus TaxID=56871 RepID=UPI0034CDB084
MATTRRTTRLSAAAGRDENAISQASNVRVTRAKAALESKTVNTGTASSGLISKQGQANTRKRAALGDVSNVNKDVNQIDKSGKPAAKMVKTAASAIAKTHTIRSSHELNDHNSTNTNAKKPTVLSTAVGTRKRRVPLRQTNVTSVNQRDTQIRPSDQLSGSSVIEDDSDGNKENEDPSLTIENNSIAEMVVDALETKKATVEQVQDWDDLDAEEMDDPTMVAEYVNEIFDYMSELERKTMPDPYYMEAQTELQWKMRDILVDWLVEVHTKFRLLPETLFLTVNIIDRFLSIRVVQLEKLQLVGITAMFIAAKYEEVFSPSIQNFVYVADSGYSEEEILRAETFILQVLDFNLSYPNPMNFLRRNSKADNYDIQTRTLAKYLMEIALVDHRFLKFYPSRVAATAMYLARDMLERSPWDRNLVHYSGGYEVDKIMPVCNLMVDYLIKPVVHDAFFKKYASKRFLKASILARQWAKKRVETHPLPHDFEDVEEDLREE